MGGRFLFLTFVILLINQTVIAREVYKWTDEEGNVHYGERPPPTGASRIKIKHRGGLEINDNPKASAQSQVSARTQRDKISQSMEADRLARKTAREKAQKDQKDRKERCAWAKDKLRRLESASGIYKLDDEGKRQYLSKDGRQRSVDRVKQRIAKYCK